MHLFAQLYSKTTTKIQSSQELKDKYNHCTQSMIPKKVIAQAPRKKRKVKQGKPTPLPDKWRQPPVGFDKKSTEQQIKIRYLARKEIKQHYMQLYQQELPNFVGPEWCRKSQDPKQDAIKKWSTPPEDYDKFTAEDKAIARYSARAALGRINKRRVAQKLAPAPLPGWCKVTQKRSLPKLAPIERWLTPPEGYEKSTGRKRSEIRLKARNGLDRHNQRNVRQGLESVDHPEWCRKIAAAPQLRPLTELMQPPIGYYELSSEMQHDRKKATRKSIDYHNSKRLTGQEKVPHPEWALACSKVERHLKPLEKLLKSPADFDTLSKRQQSSVRAMARKSIDNHNNVRAQQGKSIIEYPEWARPTRGALKAIEELNSPPEWYDEIDAKGQANARQNTRRRIDRHNRKPGVEHMPYPQWSQTEK